MGRGAKALAVAVVIAVMGIGCGSSGSDTTTTALTKDQFIKKAEAICQTGKKEKEEALASLSSEYAPTASPAEKEEAVLKLVEPYQKMTSRLASLGTPEKEGEQIGTLVEAMESAVAQVHANPQTALVSDAPFKKANETAEALGLRDCRA